jgi:hypothetical protein
MCKWVREPKKAAQPTYLRKEMPTKLTAYFETQTLALNAVAQTPS